jgi:hypothetical protein
MATGTEANCRRSGEMPWAKVVVRVDAARELDRRLIHMSEWKRNSEVVVMEFLDISNKDNT